jgi:hypothetical protein
MKRAERILAPGANLPAWAPGFHVFRYVIDNASGYWLLVDNTTWIPPFTFGFDTSLDVAGPSIAYTATLTGPTGIAAPGGGTNVRIVVFDEPADTSSRGYTTLEPVTIQGTPNVTIGGGTVGVNVLNTPSVNIGGTPNVNIANTPTVNIGGTVQATINSGTVNVQTASGVTVQSAPGLRYVGALSINTPMGSGSFTLPVTVSGLERAIVVMFHEIQRGTPAAEIQVFIERSDGSLITKWDDITRAGQPPGPIQIASPVVGYVNPALSPNWRVRVTVQNATDEQAIAYVFVDQHLPLSTLTGRNNPLDVQLDINNNRISDINRVPVRMRAEDTQVAPFAGTTSATAGTATTFTVVPALSGVTYRVIAVSLLGGATSSATLQGWIEDSSGVIYMRFGGPAKQACQMVVPGGVLLPTGSAIRLSVRSDTASQGFGASIIYEVEPTTEFTP